MIGIISFLILVFMSCFVFSTYFAQKSNYTIPVTFLGIIVFMYILAIIGFLKIGIYIIYIIFILLSIFAISKNIKHKSLKSTLKNIFTPGSFIFLFFYILIIYINFEKQCFLWDEFSHWASNVKGMYYTGDLGINNYTQFYFPEYFPSISLLQYAVMILNGEYADYILYVVYQIFVISLFLPFIKEDENNKIEKILKYILITILIFYSCTCFFDDYYSSIYIEALLSIMFAYVLLIIFDGGKYDKFKIINLTLAIVTLVLLKNVGIFFAIISLCLILLEFFSPKCNIHKKQRVKILLGILLCVIFTFCSWKCLVKISKCPVHFENPVDIVGFVNEILGKTTTYRTEVIKNYVQTLALGDYKIIYNFNIPIIFIILIISILNFGMFRKNKKSFFGVIYLGLIVYLIALLFVYCYKFTEREAQFLSSYVRYVSMYINAMFMFICFYAIYKFNTKKLFVFTMIILLISPHKELIKELNRENAKNSMLHSQILIKIAQELNTNDILKTENVIFSSGNIPFYLNYYYIAFKYFSFNELYKERTITNIFEFYDINKELEYALFSNENYYNYLILYEDFDETNDFIEQNEYLFENGIVTNSIYYIDKNIKKLVLLKSF